MNGHDLSAVSKFLPILSMFTSENTEITLNGIPGSSKLPPIILNVLKCFQLSVATFFACEFEMIGKLITWTALAHGSRFKL